MRTYLRDKYLRKLSLLKYLADVNSEKRIIDFSRGEGFDVLWIPDYDCHLDDASLLKLTFDENRIMITDDKDFGELNFFRENHRSG